MSHYEERLAADLGKLRDAVTRQGHAVEHAMRRATEAILGLDRQLASSTILEDHPVNRTAQEIDRMCHAFVARHVPSAGHLRFVSSVMRINIALERIGDYAVTICREVAQMSREPPTITARNIQTLSEHGLQVLTQALEAFRTRSADLARGTMSFASRRARSFHSIFEDLLREGQDGSRSIEDLFGLLVVLYRLERVGDQAKNICEEVVFIATGEAKAPKVYSILFVDERGDRWGPIAQSIAWKAYPHCGIYRSAGWQPTNQIAPDVLAFLDERGFDGRDLVPQRLPDAYDDLSTYHVIVGLEEGAGKALKHIPFHSVFLRWDVIPESGSLEAFRKSVAAELRSLMETLCGERAL